MKLSDCVTLMNVVNSDQLCSMTVDTDVEHMEKSIVTTGISGHEWLIVSCRKSCFNGHPSAASISLLLGDLL